MEEQNENGAPKKGDRIAKVMARAGLCSRRDAERWIEAGRVKVNGKKLTTPACVITGDDEVEVDGSIIGNKKEPTKIWLYHKPRGKITSHKDPQGRPTVFDSLPARMGRLISLGRLDYNTEGLLILTNDGEFSRYATLPKTGWKRKYRVRVIGTVTQKQLDSMAKGVAVKDPKTGKMIRYGKVQARFTREEEAKGKNIWLEMIITEGKYREIRRICEHFGLTVSRLIRTEYGPFQLGNLPMGELHEITGKALQIKLASWLEHDQEGK